LRSLDGAAFLALAQVSVKTRFDLKEKHVPAYLQGKLDLNKFVEKMQALGKSDREITEFKTLWTEIRQVLEYQLSTR
jgi:SPX domain protein involved in polyphosphate accumulation